MHADAKLTVVKPWEMEAVNDCLCMPTSCLCCIFYENIDFILISLSIHVRYWTCTYNIQIYKYLTTDNPV